MEKLIIEPTKTTPYICFDPSGKKFEISGQSFPEDPREFYTPLFTWIEEFLSKINTPIFLKLHPEYFNSASNRVLLKLFRILEMHVQTGKIIEISWSYCDEDSENDALIFKRIINIPFHLVFVASES